MSLYEELLIKWLTQSDVQQKCLNVSCHVSDKKWSTYLVSKLDAIPSASIPLAIAFERTRPRSIRRKRNKTVIKT